jgi:LCP family protein required for cell wall assembly
LNAVYNNVPALYPELELSGADANKLAVSGALGLDIHYYVMINLDGFEAIIDALGTITIDVGERVPVDYGHRPEDPNCVNLAKKWIEPGRQEMDGTTALMYSRSRCVSDNYRRMERQECVIRAVIDRAEPLTVATRYQSLASATKDMVRTDIPSDLFPAFIELLVDVKGSKIRSMSLDHDLFAKIGGSPQSPDYEALHESVQDKLAPSKPGGSGSEPGRVKSDEPTEDESPC